MTVPTPYSTPTCNNPLECHEPENALNVELEADVATGDLRLLPNEDGDMAEDQMQSMEGAVVPDLDGPPPLHATDGEEETSREDKKMENGEREEEAEEEEDGMEEEEEDEEEEEYKGEEEEEEEEEEDGEQRKVIR